MKNNNYTSFFKTKPKKVERCIRCRKCGGNMEWVERWRETEEEAVEQWNRRVNDKEDSNNHEL